jgi:hypothetical protein
MYDGNLKHTPPYGKMAHLLPLPLDMQIEIESTVTRLKMAEVVEQLNLVCEDFWSQTKEGAKSNYHTYWMLDEAEQERLSQEEIDDWYSLVYEGMDQDLYISKWGSYRFELCIGAVMTRDPEEAYFESLPLPSY